VSLAVLAAIVIAAWWLVKLGLHPLRAMGATAHRIASGDMSTRVAGAEAHTEVGELARDLNVMLDRLESAFSEKAETEARLRRFVADASHELRTPVTAIRGYAELGRIGVLASNEEVTRAMSRIETEAKQLGLLVDDLLTLATADEMRPMRKVRLDLADVAEECAAAMRARSPEHPLTTSLDHVYLLADPDRLRQVISNVLNNAAMHTAPGTAVTLRVGPSPDARTATIRVCDEGPGMEEASVARAFERFYRADPSRTRATGGAGLGLSIVEALVREQGGTVTLTSTSGQGTTVTIAFPCNAQECEPEGSHSVEEASSEGLLR
jgi:two-component system OmpR family sensor kinase